MKCCSSKGLTVRDLERCRKWHSSRVHTAQKSAQYCSFLPGQYALACHERCDDMMILVSLNWQCKPEGLTWETWLYCRWYRNSRGRMAQRSAHCCPRLPGNSAPVRHSRCIHRNFHNTPTHCTAQHGPSVMCRPAIKRGVQILLHSQSPG